MSDWSCVVCCVSVLTHHHFWLVVCCVSNYRFLVCNTKLYNFTEVKIRIWTVGFPRQDESSRNHLQMTIKSLWSDHHDIHLNEPGSTLWIFSPYFLSIQIVSVHYMRDNLTLCGYLCIWVWKVWWSVTFWREQPWRIVNLHFCRMDKAIIAWSWCDLSVGLLSIRQKWKLRSLDRKIVIFEFVSDADDLVTPKKSHECPRRP